MAYETLRWKLFPFSLRERAEQCYTHKRGTVNGDWEQLRERFCVAFFPISHIASLQAEILNFQHLEKETIGAAWDRFLRLTQTRPDLSKPNHALLQHFWLGLNKETALFLDTTVGGSFMHKTTSEGEALLDRILENTFFTRGLPVDDSSVIEEVPQVESTPLLIDQLDTTSESSPKPLTHEEEEIQPLESPSDFEDNIVQDFGNTS